MAHESFEDIETSKLMNELRAQVIKERDTKIDKITKAILTQKT